MKRWSSKYFGSEILQQFILENHYLILESTKYKKDQNK